MGGEIVLGFIQKGKLLMNYSYSALEISFGVLLAIALPRQTVGDEALKALLPPHAVWSMRYDSKLDGEVTGKVADAVRWEFTVRNDRVTGGLAGLKPGDAFEVAVHVD